MTDRIHPTARVHPTAVVDLSAELGADVVVGPLAVVGARVVLGPGCEVGGQAQVQGPSRFGRGNRIFPHACVGFEPQDVKYKGEDVFLEVGDDNQFRELTTVHRGTGGGGGLTTIGSGNLFMAYSHVAHDCHVGDRTIFVNGATLAGHVEVGDDAVIGAYSAVHQFCRVGRHAYVGGYTVVTMDALPFAKTVGQKATYYGLNTIGLRRKGFARETVARIDEAMKLLVHSGLNTRQAIERIEAELGGAPEIDDLLAFLRASRRGVIKTLPGRRGERGAGGAGDDEGADDGADDGEAIAEAAAGHEAEGRARSR